MCTRGATRVWDVVAPVVHQWATCRSAEPELGVRGAERRGRVEGRVRRAMGAPSSAEYRAQLREGFGPSAAACRSARDTLAMPARAGNEEPVSGREQRDRPTGRISNQPPHSARAKRAQQWSDTASGQGSVRRACPRRRRPPGGLSARDHLRTELAAPPDRPAARAGEAPLSTISIHPLPASSLISLTSAILSDSFGMFVRRHLAVRPASKLLAASGGDPELAPPVLQRPDGVAQSAMRTPVAVIRSGVGGRQILSSLPSAHTPPARAGVNCKYRGWWSSRSARWR